MKRAIWTLLLVLVSGAGVQAQQLPDLDANSLYLGSALCRFTSGTGTPEGAVTGKVCDVFVRTDTGEIYRKLSGTGNTGWVGPSALTKSDDTNVTLTLGGSASTSLVNPASLTLGWTGTLAVARGGLGVGTLTSNGVLYGAGTGAVQVTAQGGTNTVLAANGSAPSFSTNPTVTSITTTGDATLGGNTGTSTYVSQTTGWRATAAGAGDFRYLFADELHAKSFIADLEQALAGGQIITKSVAIVAIDFGCPNAAGTQTLTVEDLPNAADMQVFESGDTVALRTFSRASGALTVADCVGVVTLPNTSAVGTQAWVFTRNSGGNAGTMTGGTTVPIGTLALDFGTTGNGYYEVNAVDGAYGANSPYAQIVTWATSPVAANRTVRARFGKLTGITGAANEFGLIAGTYAASNGTYFRASNSAFELHGIDLKLWDGATNTVFINHATPSIALGNPVPTAYGTGTGIWMGKDTAYKFRVGNPSGDRLAWDGSVLTLVSSNLSIDSTGVAMTYSPSGNLAANSYRFSIPSNVAGALYGLYAQSDNSTGRSLNLLNQATTSGASANVTVAAYHGIAHGAEIGLSAVDSPAASDISLSAKTIRVIGFSGSATAFTVAGTGTAQTWSATTSHTIDIGGYTSTFTQDGTGLKIGHNSSVRNIEFRINNVTKAKFDTNGDFYTHDGNVYSLSDSQTKTRERDFTAGVSAIRGIQQALAVYRYRADLSADLSPRTTLPFVGVLAQQVRRFVPEAVREDKNGVLSMSAQPIFYATLNAIVQLDDFRLAQDARVAALEQQVRDLTTRLRLIGGLQ